VDDLNEPTPCTLLYVKGRTLSTIEVVDAIVMATRIMHGRPVPSDCAVVEVTMIKEDHEFEDLDYPDEEEGIEKLKDVEENFILWPCKDIILKTCFSPIVSPQSREDEGTPTSQNTIHNTAKFTLPSQNPRQTIPPLQNPPQTTPSPKNPPSTQPLEHHSLQHRSPPLGHSPKSPPHTTPPLQNPPPTTPPPKNPASTQPLKHHSPQHRSPPHGHSPMSPPHTTPPLQNPPPTTPHPENSTSTQPLEDHSPQHRSPPHGHSPKFPLLQNPPPTTPPLKNPPSTQPLEHHSP
jgi:hypothetical protein